MSKSSVHVSHCKLFMILSVRRFTHLYSSMTNSGSLASFPDPYGLITPSQPGKELRAISNGRCTSNVHQNDYSLDHV